MVAVYKQKGVSGSSCLVCPAQSVLVALWISQLIRCILVLNHWLFRPSGKHYYEMPLHHSISVFALSGPHIASTVQACPKSAKTSLPGLFTCVRVSPAPYIIARSTFSPHLRTTTPTTPTHTTTGENVRAAPMQGATVEDKVAACGLASCTGSGCA